MENYRIIEYNNNLLEDFRIYLEKVFPDYSINYINYLLTHASGRMPAKVVVNNSGRIVGCHLYTCSRAMINSKECDILWGHDTFLDEECRRFIGLDFVLSIQAIKGFGLGLTKSAEDIHRKFRNVFIGGVFTYYTINWKILFSLFHKFFPFRPVIDGPEVLRVGKFFFKRVKDANEILIPNNGYWFKDYRDIDFIRNQDFINERFINSTVYDYVVYSHNTDGESCYFVARTTTYRGMPAMTLSDFRYTYDDEKTLSLIIKAVRKLALKLNIGIILFVCGDTNMKKVLRSTISYKTPYLFVTSRKDGTDQSFIITGGDSDADFLK